MDDNKMLSQTNLETLLCIVTSADMKEVQEEEATAAAYKNMTFSKIQQASAVVSVTVMWIVVVLIRFQEHVNVI